MFAYVVRRLWQTIPTLLGVVLLVFFLVTWVGGDPAYLLAGKIANPEQIENIRRQLGVDQPYHVQLWIFIKQIATGDFGASWATNEKVSAIFATRLGPSLTVLVPLLLISTLLAMAAAMRIVPNVMMQLPGLLAGAFLIERFFSIPGIGREVILAVERSDFPIIKAVTVYVAIATMVVNLAADLLYKAIDPRVQLK